MYGDNSTPIFPKEDALTMIRLALAEDVRSGDVTSAWTIPENQNQHARLIAKEDGVLAGLPVIELVFAELNANVNVTLHKQDGDVVKKGDLIAELEGSTRDLLTGERTLLNFIQIHLHVINLVNWQLITIGKREFKCFRRRIDIC